MGEGEGDGGEFLINTPAFQQTRQIYDRLQDKLYLVYETAISIIRDVL